MFNEISLSKEKKVEYIELIYDLIFVYIIGRNNLLLHNFKDGFVVPAAFAVYIVTTLAIIQIWNYTTYYVNIYGRHGVRDHVFLFINMFLLYFIGEGTRTDWQGFYIQYHIAWALILINIGVQYLMELRNQKDEKQNRKHIFKMAFILFSEALIVASCILLYNITEASWLSLAAILLSMCAVMMFGQKSSASFVDFMHLSERAMLYVVLTFGEMIIVITSYFEGDFSLRSTYFALMAFLIVVGLFLSYGAFYDRVVDREKETNGLSYMLLHILIIFSLNNITGGLEFMREEEILLFPKIIFLIVSLLLFFTALFILGNRYAKARCKKYSRLCLRAAALGLIFIFLMLFLREHMIINILLTAMFIFAIFGMINMYGRKIDKDVM